MQGGLMKPRVSFNSVSGIELVAYFQLQAGSSPHVGADNKRAKIA
jgi:hypothetical protein